MLDKGLHISSLFSAPCFKSSCFLVDWLHCADLGITADWLAGLFLYTLPKLEGHTQKHRLQTLWQQLQSFYKENAVTARLDMLIFSMLKKNNAFPKLRAKAAESRALVPFGLQLANTYLCSTEEENTVRLAMQHLFNCYELLSPRTFCAEKMASESKFFCLLYCALEQLQPHLFHIRPKLHLWQELTQMSRSCPSLFWTYRDEEFGGTAALLSKRRGGSNNPTATAFALLNKFRGKHCVPALD
jgi:hypothetical protein